MKKILMYPHGGSYNHGCEAIVKTTAHVMESVFNIEDKNKKILISKRPHEDLEFGVQENCTVLPETTNLNKLSFDYLKGFIRFRLLGDKTYFDRYAYKNIIENSDKDTLAVSIGGDNYCYGAPKDIYFMNSNIRPKGAYNILWGCSIEPSAIDEGMKADLKQYKWIFARETLTFEALKKNGVNNVKLCPDPAFLLEPQETDLPKGFQEGNTIGINLSPMIMSYEKNDGMAYKNYENLVDYLLESTSYQIALIPHVMWDHNDDRIPLKKLYDKYKGTGRVIFVAEDNKLNASELKYIISKCNIFIAARTHSSIAAYSQCVPTLVVGYSVKALGIAKDLFGTQEGYVIPVQRLDEEKNLTNLFIDFEKRQQQVKSHLIDMMPEYKSRIIGIASEIKNEA
ncbi:polysaccharide pyruvyl transferase family protein [Croceivirga radicis]|uniref:polysaccharide pyruvyl transferase family protein n=1 Tax=Croceivirga radicis TaxID=1929488 RepID=UPI000255B2B3|nr:polysaccharide pyruvyl transferase family protein [Croceivirga radicis]